MDRFVFEFDDYKAFILAYIESAPNGGRGVRRRLSQAAGCQVAYISHVLAGDKHLSPEQAEAVARFFHLREEELDFFLLLVQLARAGTLQLKNQVLRQIEFRKREFQEVKKRLRINEEISPIDQALYYSSWHFQAIHSLFTIPEFQTNHQSGTSIEALIAIRLSLDIERVHEVLTFLLEKGLIEKRQKSFHVSEKQIHLPRTSPLISKLHSNWRVRTLGALDRIRADDYHYSGLVTLSHDDARRVREILMKALEASIDVVKPSKEEKICVLAMDFFEL